MAVIVAVEDPAFLIAVLRIVGGIEIENDLRRRTPMRLQEHIDEQRLDCRCVMAHLVIPRRLGAAQLQPVQRRLASQRCTVRAFRRKLAGDNRQHWIVPKFIVVVEVFVAQRDADHPLQHHRGDLVLHQFRYPRVDEARCEPIR